MHVGFGSLWHRSPSGHRSLEQELGTSAARAWGCQVCLGRDSATPADFSALQAPGVRAALVPWPTRSLSVSQPRPPARTCPKEAEAASVQGPVPFLLQLSRQPWGLLLLP